MIFNNFLIGSPNSWQFNNFLLQACIGQSQLTIETLWEFQLMGSKNEALTVRKKQLTTPDWRGNHDEKGWSYMKLWSHCPQKSQESIFEVSCHILLLSFPLRVWGLFWFLKWIFFRGNLKMQYSLRFWSNFACICLEYSWALTGAWHLSLLPQMFCVQRKGGLPLVGCEQEARWSCQLPCAGVFLATASCWVPLNGLQMVRKKTSWHSKRTSLQCFVGKDL